MSGSSELREACAEAARRGGAVVRERFGQRRTVELKGSIDLVTDADRASEAAVLGLLHARFPGSAVLAEESGRSGADTSEARLRWYVDSLDGTTNFAHGYPCFCASVALVADGVTVAGAVYEPLREELYTGQHRIGKRVAS